MRRFRSLPRGFIWLACLAFVMVRLTGAHLHVCLDGTEPPVSVHLSEFEGHDAHDNAAMFSTDWDFKLNGDALAKKIDTSLFTAVLLFVAILLWRRWQPTVVRIPAQRSAFVKIASIFRLHPPLRGPPA